MGTRWRRDTLKEQRHAKTKATDSGLETGWIHYTSTCGGRLTAPWHAEAYLGAASQARPYLEAK